MAPGEQQFVVLWKSGRPASVPVLPSIGPVCNKVIAPNGLPLGVAGYGSDGCYSNFLHWHFSVAYSSTHAVVAYYTFHTVSNVDRTIILTEEKRKVERNIRFYYWTKERKLTPVEPLSKGHYGAQLILLGTLLEFPHDTR